MAEINTVNLINQMRAMGVQAEGSSGLSPVNQPAFNAVLEQALNQVNDSMQAADNLKARFEKEDPSVSFSDASIAGQKARLGFQAVLSVRNKVLQAYQDIMNMPV